MWWWWWWSRKALHSGPVAWDFRDSSLYGCYWAQWVTDVWHPCPLCSTPLHVKQETKNWHWMWGCFFLLSLRMVFSAIPPPPIPFMFILLYLCDMVNSPEDSLMNVDPLVRTLLSPSHLGIDSHHQWYIFPHFSEHYRCFSLSHGSTLTEAASILCSCSI